MTRKFSYFFYLTIMYRYRKTFNFVLFCFSMIGSCEIMSIIEIREPDRRVCWGLEILYKLKKIKFYSLSTDFFFFFQSLLYFFYFLNLTSKMLGLFRFIGGSVSQESNRNQVFFSRKHLLRFTKCLPRFTNRWICRKSVSRHKSES